MQAIKNWCLLLTWLVILPGVADAQIAKFFQRASEAPRQTHAPRSAQPVVDRAVKQVQYDAALPAAIVPSPLTEASIPNLGIQAAAVEYGSNVAAPPAETIAAPPAISSGEMAAQPIFAESMSDPYLQEAIVDSGFGQPYDIPIGDVIPQTAETYSSGDWFRGGNWYTRQQVVMLLRADLPHQHVAVDRSTFLVGTDADGNPVRVPIDDPNSAPSMSTKNTDFTFEAGTRLTLGHRIGRDPANRDHSIEFTFFGLFDYTGRASLAATNQGIGAGVTSLLGSQESTFSNLTGQGGLGFPTINNIRGFTANTRADILHQADFNSFELNYVTGARPAKDRLVMQPDGRWVRHATPSKVRGTFIGLRYVRQNDLFQYRGVGQELPNGTAEVDTGGTYLVTTDNDLLGIQIGGEFVQKRADWVFGMRGKVGGFVNFADRANRISQTLAFAETIDGTATRVVRTVEDELELSDETLTFLGEGNLYVAYYIRPNTSLRLGYDIIYMNGLATATNNLGIRGAQLADDNRSVAAEFARFELTGDSLYHGMNVGFEFTW